MPTRRTAQQKRRKVCANQAPPACPPDDWGQPPALKQHQPAGGGWQWRLAAVVRVLLHIVVLLGAASCCGAVLFSAFMLSAGDSRVGHNASQHNVIAAARLHSMLEWSTVLLWASACVMACWVRQLQLCSWHGGGSHCCKGMRGKRSWRGRSRLCIGCHMAMCVLLLIASAGVCCIAAAKLGNMSSVLGVSRAVAEEDTCAAGPPLYPAMWLAEIAGSVVGCACGCAAHIRWSQASAAGCTLRRRGCFRHMYRVAIGYTWSCRAAVGGVLLLLHVLVLRWIGARIALVTAIGHGSHSMVQNAGGVMPLIVHLVQYLQPADAVIAGLQAVQVGLCLWAGHCAWKHVTAVKCMADAMYKRVLLAVWGGACTCRDPKFLARRRGTLSRKGRVALRRALHAVHSSMLECWVATEAVATHAAVCVCTAVAVLVSVCAAVSLGWLSAAQLLHISMYCAPTAAGFAVVKQLAFVWRLSRCVSMLIKLRVYQHNLLKIAALFNVRLSYTYIHTYNKRTCCCTLVLFQE